VDSNTLGSRGRSHKIGFAAIVPFTVYGILEIEYLRLGFVDNDAIDQVWSTCELA
jgi:hypothetical protein